MKTNATKYLDLFLNKQNIFVLGFLIFFLISRRGWNFLRDLSRQPGVLIPALAALTMYSLVLVEWRYVGAFVVLFWLAVASAFRFPRSDEARRLAGCVCIAMVLVIGAQEAYPLVWRVIIRREAQDHVQWQIADGLSRMGIQPGDKVANIGDSKHAYWARLGRTQIVAEIRGKEPGQLYFWAPTLWLSLESSAPSPALARKL